MDYLRILAWCAGHIPLWPERTRQQVGAELSGYAVTLHCRTGPAGGGFGAPEPMARLVHTVDGDWVLSCFDGHRAQFRSYRDAFSRAELHDVLAEIDRDPFDVFWGVRADDRRCARRRSSPTGSAREFVTAG
jgi:hypothetical protein